MIAKLLDESETEESLKKAESNAPSDEVASMVGGPEEDSFL
jgi:hypothetical protein